ncbi:MAG: hypothetical protein ASARMPRED_008119 [Alectoria sarmentosa]|nr:MAG: hypothetical protein ASARMPRED_008119 [Alectoria sarmentosa]
MRSVSSNSPKGWLNDSMIDILLEIMAASRNKRHRMQNTVFAISFVVDNLFKIHPKAGAKGLGLDDSTLHDIDLLFFPTHVGSHRMLIAAFPRTRSLELCDSLKTGKPSQLTAVRDWIKAVKGEVPTETLDMKEMDCP